MSKMLKAFKKKNQTIVVNPEIILAENEENTALEVKSNQIQVLEPNTKISDNLVKAGYPELAEKLRSLQLTEGLDALDPLMARIKLVERHVDSLLSFGHPIESEELSRLLGIVSDAAQLRAKSLLLPYGQVSPRSLSHGNRGGSVNVAVGIGNAVSPRSISKHKN